MAVEEIFEHSFAKVEVWNKADFIGLRLDLLEVLLWLRLHQVVHLGGVSLHLVEVDVRVGKFEVGQQPRLALSGQRCDLDVFIVDLSPLLDELAFRLVSLTFQH